MLLMSENVVVFDVDTAFGPIFSSHVWSIVLLAIVCPKERVKVGAIR